MSCDGFVTHSSEVRSFFVILLKHLKFATRNLSRETGYIPYKSFNVHPTTALASVSPR